MKLLFFPGGSYIGGLEIVTLSLMQELRAQGHPCLAVVSGWNNGQYPAKLAEAGIPHQSIKLARFHLRKPAWNLDGLINFPRSARQLKAALSEFRPDVIVLPSIEFAVTVLQVLPVNLPLLLHVHDVPNRHWHSWTGRYVLARTSGVVCVSHYVRGLVEAITGDTLPIFTVHNGVPAAEPARGAPYPKLRIGIIGQLIPRKKHDVLVDAVGLLRPEQRAPLEVRIYGANTTDYARDIAQRIELAGLASCFRWMGFVNSHAEIYGDLDIVVAPAVDEPFGTTVLEAGSWGLPVIAARSGGFPEMVIDHQTGLLIEPQSPPSLAGGLAALLDPDKRRALRNNAREHVSATFNQTLTARNFVAAIRSSIAQPSAGRSNVY